MGGLPCPYLESESGACKAGVVSKGGDTTVGFVLEEFEVVEGGLVTAERFSVARLLFKDVSELDMFVNEGDYFQLSAFVQAAF